MSEEDEEFTWKDELLKSLADGDADGVLEELIYRFLNCSVDLNKQHPKFVAAVLALIDYNPEIFPIITLGGEDLDAFAHSDDGPNENVGVDDPLGDDEVPVMQDDFPVLRSFLRSIPDGIDDLHIHIHSKCPESVFNAFPDCIEGPQRIYFGRQQGPARFLHRHVENKEASHSRNGTLEHMLYCCRSIPIIYIYGFKASIKDPAVSPLPAFTSVCKNLTIQSCFFQGSTGQLLSDTTKFPNLEQLSFITQPYRQLYAIMEESSRKEDARMVRAKELAIGDKTKFWSQWLVAAKKALSVIKFTDNLQSKKNVEPNDHGYSLFKSLSQALSQADLVGMIELYVNGNSYDIDQLSNLGPLAQSKNFSRLKKLTLSARHLNKELSKILLKFPALKDLTLRNNYGYRMGSTREPNEFLVEYLSQKELSLSSLTLGRFPLNKSTIALIPWTSPKSLTLDKYSLEYEEEGITEALVAKLSDNSISLRSLKFLWPRMDGQKCPEPLIQIISRCSAITSFDLSIEWELSEYCAEELVKAFESSGISRLLEFSITFNCRWLKISIDHQRRIDAQCLINKTVNFLDGTSTIPHGLLPELLHRVDRKAGAPGMFKIIHRCLLRAGSVKGGSEHQPSKRARTI